MTTAPPAGGRVELKIDSLAAGGDGVGRDPSGRVVFVPYTAPGDRVLVDLVERKDRYARGKLAQLVAPGPGRVEPGCVAFGRCGGCAWQHLSYPLQCRAKERIIRDALERIGGIRGVTLRWYASPATYGYRERARVAVVAGRVGFRRERSREVAAIESCPVLLPAVDAALSALAADPPSDGEWELVVDDTGAASATDLAGAPIRRSLRVGGEELAVSSGVFSQANAFLTTRWSRYICEAVGSGRRVLELFAGSGTLSLSLARLAKRLVAVEGDRRACAHLRENLENAALHAEVIEARVEPAALAAWLERHRPEVVVLDPPRGGLGKKASEALGASGAASIIYAACDPAPWARDLRVLGEAGFAIDAVAGFDFFPQSAHVESVALLTRR